MSTRSVFTLVGAAIGSYFGNTALGAAIGSYVGGVVDPTKVKGPRITDAQTQTSQDGVPIPIIYGTVRISGNIIATSQLTEHKKKDNGKGSGTETTTYTYTRTYAIGICEGPIYRVRRIWRDGKLVLDMTDALFNSYDQRIANQQFMAKADIYYGDEEQEPNSALQAIFGAEEVPAFRGLAYIVLRDDDLTDRAGSVPSYEFEVTQYGSSVESGEYVASVYPTYRFKVAAPIFRDPRADNALYQYGVWNNDQDMVRNWYPTLAQAKSEAAVIMGYDIFDGRQMGWSYDAVFQGPNGAGPIQGTAPAQSIADPNGTTRAILGMVYATQEFQNEFFDPIELRDIDIDRVSDGGDYYHYVTNGGSQARYCGVFSKKPKEHPYNENVIRLETGTLYCYPSVIIAIDVLPSCTLGADPTWVQIPGTPDFYLDQTGHIHRVGTCDEVTADFTQLRARVVTANGLDIASFPIGPVMKTDDPNNTRAFWEEAYAEQVALGLAPPGWTYGSDYPQGVSIACYCATDEEVTPVSPVLGEIVGDICLRKGVPANEFDVSELTDVVLGFTLAAATSAADAINALAPAYLFDGSEYDGKIHFRKRGGPTLLALNEQDAFDSQDGRIIETRAQELELARKMVVSYMDVNANYAVTTQTAERLSSSVASTGTDQVEISAVMDADKAAKVADTLLKDQWSSINGTLALSIPDYYSELVPADVLFLSYEQATFRARVTKVQNSEGILSIELQQDSASAYSSVATGVPPRPAEEGGSTVLGPTFYEVMNLPALRDKDDQPGVYITANGPIGKWPGAQIAISYDLGATWTDVQQITQAGTLGVLQDHLPVWGREIPDGVNKVDVAISSGDFESTTLDQMFVGANPICVGDEVLQFRTETMPEEKEFLLGNPLFRGRKNTQPMTWDVGTRVASLSDAYFIPIDRSRIGSVIQFRATTFGTDIQYGVIKSLAFNTAKSVQEWAPTNVRSQRDTDQSLSLQWSPRHRLGTSRNPYASVYFTGYQLVFSNGTISKTVATTDQSYSYSASDQIADFGSTGPLSVTLYATNSIIGPGEGITVSA